MTTPQLPPAFPLSWPDDWPRTTVHRPSRYRTTFAVARDAMVVALRKLTRAPRPTFALSTDIPLRLDGLPYSNAREPADTGAALWWLEYRGRERVLRVLTCDGWKSTRENVRAIGLSIDALLTLRRAGASTVLDHIARSFERTALPAPVNHPQWWTDLGLENWPPTVEEIVAAYRAAAKEHHPDMGGSANAFIRVQEAYRAALAWTAEHS